MNRPTPEILQLADPVFDIIRKWYNEYGCVSWNMATMDPDYKLIAYYFENYRDGAVAERQANLPVVTKTTKDKNIKAILDHDSDYERFILEARSNGE